MAASSGKQGNDSQQRLDRLREEEDDVAYRATYRSLEGRTAEISALKNTQVAGHQSIQFLPGVVVS